MHTPNLNEGMNDSSFVPARENAARICETIASTLSQSNLHHKYELQFWPRGYIIYRWWIPSAMQSLHLIDMSTLTLAAYRQTI